MSSKNPQIDALRKALNASPENIPLRCLLANTLLEIEAFDQAEVEFRHAMRLAPSDVDVMIGLACAFHGQGKNALALQVFEEHLFPENNEVPGQAFIVYAQILMHSGRPQDAVEAYRDGIRRDPNAGDEALAAQLGIGAGANALESSEIFEGKLRSAADDFGDEDNFNVIDSPEKPKINFASVGGMEHVKDEIRMKIILPLTNKDLYEAYGKKTGGGILMYGPPGCGKTHLARATAGEIKSGFISVGLHDVLDMWIGQSEKRLHQIFEQARRNTPCVLFFDEVDALAASRSDMRKSAGRHLINQFLSELDGVEYDNEGVLILAATNAPWHLDSAFRRPGRFDRILFVPPPDEAARASILQINLSNKPTESIDLQKAARKTPDYSGADIKSVVELATEEALREAMRSGKPVPITEKIIQNAIKKQLPSTREWFATARNHALYANDSGLYDEILQYLNIRK